MKHRHSLSFVVVLIAGSAWAQQLNVDSFNGSFNVNGSAYGGGGLSWGDLGEITANESLSSASFSSGPSLGFGARRSMMKFSAGSESADYMLPSDRDGNMTMASSGESRIFGTWNPDNMPTTANHSFNMSVEEFDGFDATASIDVQEAKQPRVVGTSGVFTVGGLDGSAIDSDPRVGFVKINTDDFPSFSMAFENIGMTFNREQIQWQDNTVSNSIFYDMSWQGAWTYFENLDGGNGGIFTQDETNRHTWNPGDGPSNESFAGYNSVLNMNLSQLAWGNYRVKHWAIGWWGIGDTETAQYNSAFGSIESEIEELNVRVVPEPSSILALAFGAGVIMRSRRAKARN